MSIEGFKRAVAIVTKHKAASLVKMETAMMSILGGLFNGKMLKKFMADEAEMLRETSAEVHDLFGVSDFDQERTVRSSGSRQPSRSRPADVAAVARQFHTDFSRLVGYRVPDWGTLNQLAAKQQALRKQMAAGKHDGPDLSNVR